MAIIKFGTTRNANRLITYAEKRSEYAQGIETSPAYVKVQFAATRALYGKFEGLQAHHIIQSFAPNEVTAETANEIGKKLAEQMANGYEAVIYTHTDKEHIHNHIIINSVSYENGKKFQLHGIKAIENIRALSDQLCKEYQLSIIEKPTAKIRYTLAEQSILEKKQNSWKDELRQAIDLEKTASNSYEEFKKNLQDKYQIEVNDQRKHITYKHPDQKKVVRGNKLGLDYERNIIENGFKRQITEQSNGKELNSPRNSSHKQFGNSSQREYGTQSANEKLYRHSDGQRYNQQPNFIERDIGHRINEQTNPDGNAFDFGKAEKHIRDTAKTNASAVGKVSEADVRTREESERKAYELEQKHRTEHKTRADFHKSKSREDER